MKPSYLFAQKVLLLKQGSNFDSALLSLPQAYLRSMYPELLSPEALRADMETLGLRYLTAGVKGKDSFIFDDFTFGLVHEELFRLFYERNIYMETGSRSWDSITQKVGIRSSLAQKVARSTWVFDQAISEIQGEEPDVGHYYGNPTEAYLRLLTHDLDQLNAGL